MAIERIPTDPDAGIPDLFRQLGDDSKRLVADEVRLAKLEMKESVQRAGRGAVQLAVAFGIGVVMLVAVTLSLATLIGRLAAGHMWVGALVTGLLTDALVAPLPQSSVQRRHLGRRLKGRA